MHRFLIVVIIGKSFATYWQPPSSCSQHHLTGGISSEVIRKPWYRNNFLRQGSWNRIYRKDCLNTSEHFVVAYFLHRSRLLISWLLSLTWIVLEHIGIGKPGERPTENQRHMGTCFSLKWRSHLYETTNQFYNWSRILQWPPMQIDSQSVPILYGRWEIGSGLFLHKQWFPTDW